LVRELTLTDAVRAGSNVRGPHARPRARLAAAGHVPDDVPQHDDAERNAQQPGSDVTHDLSFKKPSTGLVIESRAVAASAEQEADQIAFLRGRRWTPSCNGLLAGARDRRGVQRIDTSRREARQIRNCRATRAALARGASGISGGSSGDVASRGGRAEET
jgi:hypothetical protein